MQMHGHDYRSLPAEMTLYKYPVRKYTVPLTVLCIVLNFDIVLRMSGPIVLACFHSFISCCFKHTLQANFFTLIPVNVYPCLCRGPIIDMHILSVDVCRQIHSSVFVSTQA